MNVTNKKLMIYGANGYTGQLITAEAVKQGFRPIIAGRNRLAIEILAKELELESRIFSLNFESEVVQNISDIHLVIHCAGPFSSTAEPMMRACIESKTHYTDITGEIDVFEMAHSFDRTAQESGIVICPGVGFDVVPTDCLASLLKDKMPDATYLTLGFDSGSGMSPGSAKTSIEGIAAGGRARVNGKIVKVPLAYKQRQIDFGNGSKNAITIPWGDISTAYYSTGIPNIEVYIPISPRGAKRIRKMNWFRWLVKLKLIQNKMKEKAGNSTKGPNESQRNKFTSYLWGEVKNSAGEKVVARFETCNGYQLTYLAAVEVAKHLFEHDAKGVCTPSQLVDNRLVFRIAGTSEILFSKE